MYNRTASTSPSTRGTTSTPPYLTENPRYAIKVGMRVACRLSGRKGIVVANDFYNAMTEIHFDGNSKEHITLIPWQELIVLEE